MASIVAELRSGPPKPQDKTRRIEIIGSGTGRTGTMSFSAALKILLGGEVYHTGTMIMHNEGDARKWGEALDVNTTPARVKTNLSSVLDGYVAVTDACGAAMTTELLEMYPSAIVISTIRDPDEWWKSVSKIKAQTPPLWVSKLVASQVPVFRALPGTLESLWARLNKNYGIDLPFAKGPTKEFITMHDDWLKRVVPASKLHFFDVKEGWEPLCRILNVPIPDVPFPKANEQAAMTKLFQRMITQACVSWGFLIGIVVSFGTLAWRFGGRTFVVS